MFSVKSDLFLKAESNITNADQTLENEKDNLDDIKKYGSDFKKDVNSLVDDITSVKKDIKDLLAVVNKTKTSVSDLNSNSNSTSGYSIEELEGMNFGSSVVGLNQNLDIQISSFANLSENEYFALIDNCSFLLESDKELAKKLFQEGNLRASFVVILRADLENEKKLKEEQLAELEDISEEEKYNDPDYSRYRGLCTVEYIDENDSDYELFQNLKAKFENYDNNEEIQKLQQEIVALEQQKYRYDVAIKEWSFDYLDKNSDYLNYEVNSSSLTNLLALCKEYYQLNENMLTIVDFNHACEVLNINPYEINMILFYQELLNSDWFLEKDNFFDYYLISTDLNNIGSLQARAFLYLSSEELKKYHYLYETEGIDSANKYLLTKEDSINNLQGMEQAIETIKAIESGNYSATRIGNAFIEGIKGGVTNWLNNIFTVFNRNTTMTSQEYEDMYVAQMLIGVLSSQVISESDLDLLYKNGEIDEKVYNNLVDKGGSITNYDLMYAKGDITESEYLGFKQLSTNQEYQNLVNKISNSNIFGIDINEGSWLSTFYSAGNSTGYMVPSVLMSLMCNGVSPTVGRLLSSVSMGLSSYGGSYKEAIRTGANDLNATIFALLSAGSEVGLEIALGGIAGIAKGEDFIDLGVDISKMNSYLNVIGNSIKSYGGSIASEIEEELIQLVLGKVLEGTVLNRPIDFSGIEGEALQTVLCTIITTSALNLPSNVLNFGVQSYEYLNYANSVQLSIDLGNGNIVEYTGKQLMEFIDSNGNINENKVKADAEIKIKNQNTQGENKNKPNLDYIIDGYLNKLPKKIMKDINATSVELKDLFQNTPERANQILDKLNQQLKQDGLPTISLDKNGNLKANNTNFGYKAMDTIRLPDGVHMNQIADATTLESVKLFISDLNDLLPQNWQNYILNGELKILTEYMAGITTDKSILNGSFKVVPKICYSDSAKMDYFMNAVGKELEELNFWFNDRLEIIGKNIVERIEKSVSQTNTIEIQELDLNKPLSEQLAVNVPEYEQVATDTDLEAVNMAIADYKTLETAIEMQKVKTEQVNNSYGVNSSEGRGQALILDNMKIQAEEMYQSLKEKYQNLVNNIKSKLEQTIVQTEDIEVIDEDITTPKIEKKLDEEKNITDNVQPSIKTETFVDPIADINDQVEDLNDADVSSNQNLYSQVSLDKYYDIFKNLNSNILEGNTIPQVPILEQEILDKYILGKSFSISEMARVYDEMLNNGIKITPGEVYALFLDSSIKNLATDYMPEKSIYIDSKIEQHMFKRLEKYLSNKSSYDFKQFAMTLYAEIFSLNSERLEINENSFYRILKLQSLTKEFGKICNNDLNYSDFNIDLDTYYTIENYLDILPEKNDPNYYKAVADLYLKLIDEKIKITKNDLAIIVERETQKSLGFGLNLKNEVLSIIDLSLDKASLIKQIYIELNKRLHYDESYFVGNDALKTIIYKYNASFDNLKNENVICKGWSQLYREILIEAGFSSDDIKIVSNNGAHYWIEIDLKDGNIIIADATDTNPILHANDLVNAKSGEVLAGLLILDKLKFTGSRLLNLYRADGTKLIEYAKHIWKNVDAKLNYTHNGMYYPELQTKAASMFGGSPIYKENFASVDTKLKIMKNINIPSEMDNFEKRIYLKNIAMSIFGEKIFEIRDEKKYINGNKTTIITMEVCDQTEKKYIIYGVDGENIIFNDKFTYEEYISNWHN